MPHLKCAPCRIRLHTSDSSVGGVGDLCPSCGALLEPVGDLSALVGVRAARLDPHQAQRQADVGRWLDDGGIFEPEARAQAVALPRPERFDA